MIFNYDAGKIKVIKKLKGSSPVISIPYSIAAYLLLFPTLKAAAAL